MSGLTLLIGGVGGALATRALYGETQEVDPVPAEQLKSDCAPCPQCPVCPAPVDCGELGVIPNDPALAEEGEGEGIGTVSDVPGLPASALPLAMTAVRSSIKTCMAQETSMSGMVLLEVTAAATGTVGAIREATVTQATGEAEGAEITDCIKSAAEAATFAWDGAEGELKFKLPVKIGR